MDNQRYHASCRFVHLRFGDESLVHKDKIKIQKTDSAILERFSSDELWIYFVEKKCQECGLPEEKCNELKARNCYDEWFQNCD